MRLPGTAEADRLLRRLGVADTDRERMLAAGPSADQQPELWSLLERCYDSLLSRMGEPGGLPPWPDVSAKGAVGRYAYVWLFLAAVPAARAYHRKHGVDDDTSWRSLGVLAAQMDNRRALYGEGGLHTQDWMTVHFRGLLFPLSRLHFERLRIDYEAPAGGPVRGEWALGLHIPPGRLTPEACDEALATARTFFRRHFPDQPYRWATCSSWVLDPQLAEYLPESSNIIRFQRRFTLLPPTDRDDNSTMVEFVFRRPLSEVDQLPVETTLQRAIVAHIRAGRRWQFRTGWFALPP